MVMLSGMVRWKRMVRARDDMRDGQRLMDSKVKPKSGVKVNGVLGTPCRSPIPSCKGMAGDGLFDVPVILPVS